MRVDDAGNISKRLAAAGMQFATHGGTCPKWAVHKAFAHLKNTHPSIELPGGQKFFTARTVPPLWSATSGSTTEFAVALGCELHHARDIIYADHMDISKPKQLELIGIGCAACERMDCTQRAPTRRLVTNCALTAICGGSGFTISKLTSQSKSA